MDSVIDINESDYEIILVDDGSTDNSPKICDEYKCKYDFVKVLHKKNGGLATARNSGLEIAKGEYTIFIDSDDYVEEGYIDCIKRCIGSYSSDIIVLSHYIDYTELNYINACKLQEIINTTPQNAVRILESSNSFNMCCSKAYKSEMLANPKNITFEYNSEPGEDLIFNCLCFERAKTVTILDKPFYHWVRRGEDTLANCFREDLFEKNKKFINYRNNLYKNLGIDKTYIANLCTGNLNYIFACVPNMYRAGKKLERKKRLGFYKEILGTKDVSYWMSNIKVSSMLQKQFFALYKTKSPLIIDSFYLIAMGFRNTFNKIWIRVRKKYIDEKTNH